MRHLGKDTVLACPDPVPAFTTFLPGSDKIVRRVTDAFDLAVILDCGDLSRVEGVCSSEALTTVPIINVDHHDTNPHFGLVNIVDPSASATAEILVDLIQQLGGVMDSTVATCLLTGIITDTMGFRSSAVSSRTMKCAGALLDRGAQMAPIVESVYQRKTPASLQLWGKILRGVQFEDRIVWATAQQRGLELAGATYDDVKELVNFILGVRGVGVAVLFMEMPDGKTKIEFRSSGRIDVGAVAVFLGGGGHRHAAGCTVCGSWEVVREKVLAAVREAVREG